MVVIFQTEAEVIRETDREAVARLRDKLAAAMEYGRLPNDRMRRAAERAIFQGDLALMRRVALYLDRKQARELPEYARCEGEEIERTRRG